MSGTQKKEMIRKYAYAILPPLLISAYSRIRVGALKYFDLKRWWRRFQINQAIPDELRFMVNSFIDSESYTKLSHCWSSGIKLNIEQLIQFGYENFKQTVSRSYFAWIGVGFVNVYSKEILARKDSLQLLIPLQSILKKHDFFSHQDSLHYNIVTAAAYDYVMSLGGEPFFKQVGEHSDGNPLDILIDGRRISQDVVNSVCEYLSVSGGIGRDSIKTIIEVGAGSGRTSAVFCQLLPDVKYIIADIPPALYISQRYLSAVFPGRKIFRFRPFNSFEDVKEEFNASDIAFLLPHQLEMLPRKCADIFFAIDCLHEMRPQHVAYYFDHADRLAQYFYYKCWRNARVPIENTRISIGDYPVKTHWQKVFEHACVMPSDFFETLFAL